MTASSTATPQAIATSEIETLIAMMASAELTAKVERQFLPTELGSEFFRNSFVVAADGQSFTIRARNSFSYGPRGYRHRIEPGDTVKFDRDFNIIHIR